MALVLLFVVGAVVGSFLGALTWRWPKNMSIMDGRSRCPHCKHVIRGYDNIPIISYILLQGRCRDCNRKIPKRDFAIEAGTAMLFPILYLFLPSLGLNFPWFTASLAGTIVIFFIASILLAIFVIDLEHQYIPDELVFLLTLLAILVQLAVSSPLLFSYLAAGAGSSVFLLILHLATLGKGMGLGDVKLAFALGALLGFPLSVVFMFSAFILGSVVGIFLIIFGQAKLKQKIAFGPFLILGFLLAAIYGFDIMSVFLY